MLKDLTPISQSCIQTLKEKISLNFRNNVIRVHTCTCILNLYNKFVNICSYYSAKIVTLGSKLPYRYRFRLLICFFRKKLTIKK
ncbi:hypothetical protein KUTeg_015693 [Tegillarca granosa]|uniref:Uncharacterized protein n=1 Tax=Tegillarca granosa TaxID=220873 RepID=A0ABQ9ENC5_TEGGR|nr:hypothetical protein KUTeg_015693 [Tegillarca granosa]